MERGEEWVRRIDEEEVREQEAERQEELDTGEEERIEESQSKIQDPAAASADHTTHGATIHKPQRFNWARDVNDSLGLSPADPNHGDATPAPTLVNPDPSKAAGNPSIPSPQVLHPTLSSTPFAPGPQMQHLTTLTRHPFISCARVLPVGLPPLTLPPFRVREYCPSVCPH
jgi:hypothetical protein